MNPPESVLRYVNEVRANLGKPPIEELKKGARAHAGRCPVARSIDIYGGRFNVVGFYVEGDEDLQFFNAPDEVVEFALDFDNGRYPELIAK